jgi:Flp pilus assembly protein TadG
MMRPEISRGKAHRRGNAVLEAALVIPILLSLAFGTVEFGYFFYVKNQLQGAAREGVRAAIAPSATNADVTSAISTAMTAYGLQSSGYTVTTSPSNVSTATEGTAITVTIQCNWGTVGAGVRPMSLISASKSVKGVAVMRKES